MKKLIVVSDWASDWLPRQEFRSTLEGYLKDPEEVNCHFIDSTYSTIHSGFLTSQIVETEERYGRPEETVIFQNTDLRSEDKSGADFIIIKLVSDIYLCGPNAGYDFSFIKSKIDEVFSYKSFETKTQFRSRDVYARVVAHLMDDMQDELELEELRNNVIPELTGYYIGHIDNFGNIKTTIKISDFKGKYEFGSSVKIKINSIEKTARFVDNLFGGEVGELIIYPGSSGPKDNPYLEISAWNKFEENQISTGASYFNSPKPGMSVEVR